MALFKAWTGGVFGRYSGVIAAILLIGLACPVWGEQQSASTSATVQAPAESMETVEKAIQGRLKQAESIADEALRKKVTETYQQALELLQKASSSQERLERLKKERETAPAQLEEIKAKLAEPMEKTKPEVPPGSTLPQLEQILAKLQAELDAAEKRKGELETRLKMRTERRLKLPELAAKAKQCLEEAREQIKTPSGTETPETLARAQRSLLLAQIRACQAESQVYEEDLLGYDIRMDLLRAQSDLASRTLLVKQKEVTAWREVVNSYRREEAERTAEKARREAARALPAVKQLAEENAALAELLSGPDGLAAQITKVTETNDQIEKRLAELKDRFRSIQATVDKAGVTDAISLLLRKERSNLPNPDAYEQERKTIRTKMADSHFQLIQREDERAELTDVDVHVAGILAALAPDTSKWQREEIERAAREGLQTKQAYLTKLIDAYDTYIEKLADLDTNAKDLIAETDVFAAYIDEHVLWFQSTSPLGPKYFVKSWEALAWLTNPYAWYGAALSLKTDTAYYLYLDGLVVLIFICLLVLKRRFRYRLRETGLPAGDGKVESYWRTIEAMVFTGLMAAVWPLLLWFIGWRLEIAGHATDFSRAVAVGFKGMAMFLLTLEVIMKTGLSDGLAEKHFRWSPRNLKIVRKNVSWLIALTLPLVFLVVTMAAQSNELWNNSLGRLAYMVLLTALGICLWRISGPAGGGLHFTGNWLGWLKYFWYPLFVVPLILAVIAGLGFYYTAGQLGWKMMESLWLLLGLLLVHEMMLRWLYLAHRRLAIAKIEKLRTEVREEEVKHAVSPEQAPIPKEPEMNLFTISNQNRKLLRSVIGFALAIGLWFIWDDVVPALGVLHGVHLWENVTLAGFLLAVVVTVMTLIASKNLPGLLEVTMLHRLRLDSGSRFAITTLSRYLITVIGLIIAFDLVGLGWSKVQWLIAAMTVGLGFGLQEIFANFVSGLIILFERPIRVGDVVTVGDVSGTVTRIHIRATTITDWDRKELVVPNKEFITGRVINWTLSDRVIRVLIKVGVAYGTDTDKVQKLLLEAADSIPGVLREPAPSATFTGFGDSSLDFELRAYIPNVDNVLTLRHELYTAVDKKFKEAGIEIPFPQRDLHVRTIQEALAVQQSQKPDVPEKP